MNEQERNEKLGRTVVGIGWFIFVFKFIVITSVIAGVVLYFLGKPLWIAPIIAVGVFIAYKMVWGMIWRIIDRISIQK